MPPHRREVLIVDLSALSVEVVMAWLFAPDGVKVEVKTTQQNLVLFKYELEDDRQVLVLFADRYKPGTFEIRFNGPSSALLENVRRVHKHSGRRIFYHSDLKRIQKLVKPEQILKEVKV